MLPGPLRRFGWHSGTQSGAPGCGISPTVRCTASVVAGDVLELTRDVKLALDWIGKWISGWRVATCARAIRGSKRPPQLWTDCWARSATETVTQTVTESWEPWEGDLEPSEQLELIELGREDSNLQLPG